MNSFAKVGNEVRWVAAAIRSDELAVLNGNAEDHASVARGDRWMRHEILLMLLGAVTTLCLGFRAGLAQATTWQAFAATLLLFILLNHAKRSASAAWQKFRCFAAYLFIFWFYCSVAWIVPALRIPTHDAQLLAIDRVVLGQTPAVAMQSWSSVWLNELMSACYVSYLIYLHICLVQALLQDVATTKRFANWVFSVYAIGLGGYLIFPAVGPARAYADLFSTTIDGPLFTPLNRWVVQSGSSVYDAFPSLHALITLTLLDFDRRFHRRRFQIMIAPAIGIFTSAIYLRYHYLVDLVAGGGLFVVACCLLRERSPVGVETGKSE